MPDLKNLQRAANEAAGKRQPSKKPPAEPRSKKTSAALPLQPQPQPQPPRPASPSFPSRHGKIPFTFHLAADFKRGLRLIQAQRGHGCTLEGLAAEALNDLFSKHNIPTVNSE